MKNKFLLVLFFALYTVNCYSQAYHPLIETNKYWQVFTFDPLPICGVDNSAEYFFNGDTLINGFTYSKLYEHPIISLVVNPYCPPFVVDRSITGLAYNFLREDTASRKVYIIDPNNNSDQLYMDFSLNDGDTLFSNYTYYSDTIIVDSVRPYPLLNGTFTKIFYLPYGITYIEGIGDSHGLRMPLVGWWVSGAIEGTTCVTLNTTQLFNAGYPYCAGIVGLHELANEQNLSVKFNNDNNLLSINSEIDRLQLTIYNANGKNCLQSNIAKGENNISLTNLSAGCYLVKVFNENEQKVKVISINR